MIDIKKLIKQTLSIKLLYVEDNQEARQSFLDIFEDFFDDITVAIDGEDGFNKFSQNKVYDLIITDINMPKLNGIKMSEKIRKTDKEIVILMLSAHDEIELFQESIKLNVDGYIVKPLNHNQFFELLDKVVKKINLRKESEKNLNLLKQYQELTDESSIISKTNSKGIITYVNDRFCKIAGYSREELIGKNHNIVRHPDEPASIYKDLWHTIKDKKKIWKGIVRNQKKDKKSYYVQATIKPILDMDNNVIEYIALRDDITTIMNPRKQLSDLVHTSDDPLVVMMKIENFTHMENFYGHILVEKIEKKFYKKVYKIIPKECRFEKIYILGDGKFVFAKDKINCTKTTDEIINNLKHFQKEINNIKIDIDDIDYDIKVLMSVAYGEEVLEDVKLGVEELEVTKQKFILANGLANKNFKLAKDHIKVLKKVKSAIEDFRIISHFQPIVNNKTKQIVKYESLVRLVDEDGKILSPFFFLDIAKQGQYYSEITSMVLKNSFSALKNTSMDISINLSALDIEKSSIRDELFDYLIKYKNDTHRIVFELLEDENVNNIEVIKSFINDVKKLGVKIAIDDFGAGYSNFERLLEYQPDILKIDGCLIRDIVSNHYSLSVVKTIVSFAKSQNLEIVAEFIENEEIYDILNSLGVEYSQGYYFGKPKALIEWEE